MFIILNYVYCVSVCVSVYMKMKVSEKTRGLDLQFQEVASNLTRVLGVKLGSFARAVYTLNH